MLLQSRQFAVAGRSSVQPPAEDCHGCKHRSNASEDEKHDGPVPRYPHDYLCPAERSESRHDQNRHHGSIPLITARYDQAELAKLVLHLHAKRAHLAMHCLQFAASFFGNKAINRSLDDMSVDRRRCQRREARWRYRIDLEVLRIHKLHHCRIDDAPLAASKIGDLIGIELRYARCGWKVRPTCPRPHIQRHARRNAEQHSVEQKEIRPAQIQ